MATRSVSPYAVAVSTDDGNVWSAVALTNTYAFGMSAYHRKIKRWAMATGGGVNTLAYSNNLSTWTGLGMTLLAGGGWSVATDQVLPN